MEASLSLSNTGRRSRIALLPLLLGILLCTFLPQGAKAQQTVTIGTGTSTGYYCPIGTYYNYSITEQLYTADEIGMAGTIQSISFYWAFTTAKSFNINVYMANVTANNLSTGISLANTDLVYSGTLSVPSTAGWVTITLSTPFEYDGTSNLLIGFNKTGGASWFSGSTWQYTSTSNMARYTQNDSSPYDLSTIPGTVTNRPNIKMEIIPSASNCDRPDIVEVPATTIGTTSAAVNWSGGSGTYNVQYKPTSATSWTTFATNTTSTSCTLTGLNGNTTYQVRVQSVCNGEESSWRSADFTTLCQCDVTIRYNLQDSYGDGWNGAYINVYNANSNALLGSWTISSGSSASGTLTVCGNTPLRFTWTSGGYDSETSYTVYDNENNVLFSGSNALSTQTHTVQCSTCPKPQNLAINNITTNSATVTWNAGGDETSWQYSLNNGSTWTTVTSRTLPLTGLTSNTEYTVLVRAYCSANDQSSDASVTFSTPCNAMSLPYTMGFESDETTISCWSAYLNYSSSGISSGYGTYNGSYAFVFNYNENPGYLISPFIDNGGNGIELNFWYKNYSTSYTEYFQIGYTTSSNPDPTTFTYGSTISVSDGNWHEYTNEFPAGTKYIAIKYIYDDAYYLVLDDFTFSSLSNCPVPSNLTAGTPDAQSVQLDWTPGGNENQWQICVNGDESNPILVNTHPYTLSGLTQGTTYTVKVRTYCDADDQSSWSNIVSFTTEELCPAPTNVTASNLTQSTAGISWNGNAESYTVQYRPATITGTTLSQIFYDGFENGLSGWTIYIEAYHATNTTSEFNITDWHLSDNTSYGAPHTGSYSALSRSYDGEDRTVDNWLVSPQMTLGDVVKFWVLGDDTGWQEHFEIYVSTGTNAISDFVYVETPEPAPADGTWGERSVDLSAYAGQQGYIAIRHRDTGKDYLFLDDFSVYNTINTYSYGTAQTQTSTTNSCTITGLTPETFYEVLVQADCGSTDGTSNWSQGLYFTTPDACTPPTSLVSTDVTTNSASLSWADNQNSYDVRYRKVYFYEDFEGETMPTGWTAIDANGDGNTWSTGYATTHSGHSAAYNLSYIFDMYGTTPDDWLISPLIDLQGTLRVWLSGYGNERPYEHFAIYVSTSGNSISDFNTVLVGETTTSNQYVEYTADLSNYAGQAGYIAIHHFNCSDQYYLYVDDFGLYGTENWTMVTSNEATLDLTGLQPDNRYEWQVRGLNCSGTNNTDWSEVATFNTDIACYTPTEITTSNLTGNSIDISWTGDAESYNVICTPAGASYETIYHDDINADVLSPTYDNSSSYPWIASSTNHHSGNYCMSSDNVSGSNTTSSISLTQTLDGDGIIEFYSLISSEDNYDKGYFYIDGAEKLMETGSSSWTLHSYTVTAGTHTFTWSYSKDGSLNGNDDRYYIDDISIKVVLPVEAITATTTENQYGFCGLTPETDYIVYIQSDCGQEDGVSRWASTTFTTTNTPATFTAGAIVNDYVASCGTYTSQTISETTAATGINLNYQWQRNGQDIEDGFNDANGEIYLVSADEMAYLAQNPGTYTYTRLVNGVCSTNWTASEGAFTIDTRVPGTPFITEMPSGLLCGDQATLNVSSENSNNMQLMYYWYDEHPTPNSIEIAHSGSQYTTAPLTLGENTLYVQAVTYRVENNIDTIPLCSSEPTEVVLEAAAFTAAAITEIDANYCGNYFTLRINGEPTPNHTYIWYSDADCTHEVGRGNSYTLEDRQTETATYYLREYAQELEGGEFLCQSSNTGSVEVPVIPLEEPYITDPSFEFCKGDPLSDIVASGDAHDDQYQLKPFIVWYTDNETQQILDTTASESPLSRLTADTSMTLYAATASYITSYSGHMPVPTTPATQSNSGNAVFFGLTAGSSPVTLDSIDLQVPASQGVGHSVLLYYHTGALDINNTIDESSWTSVDANMEYTGGEHAIIRLSSPMSLQPNETVSILVNTGNMMQLYYNDDSQVQPGEPISNNDFLTISKGYGFQYNADFTSGLPASYPQSRSVCGTVHITVEGELEFGCMSQYRTAVTVIVDSMPKVSAITEDLDPLCNGNTLSEEVLEALMPDITWNTADEDSESTGWLLSIDGEEETLVSLTPNTQFFYGHDYSLVFRATNNCGSDETSIDVDVYGAPTFDNAELDIEEEQCINSPITVTMPSHEDHGSVATESWEYASAFDVAIEDAEFEPLDLQQGIPATGDYYIRGHIVNGCDESYTETAIVSVFDKPVIASIEDTELGICFGAEINPAVPDVNEDEYIAANKEGWLKVQDDEEADPVELTFPQTANMDWNGVRICYFATNGCGTSYSDTITLTVHPDLALTVGHNLTAPYICPAVGVVLTASTPVADATFEWSNDDEGGLTATTGNPVAAKNGTEDDEHFYTVVATDAFGCSATATTSTPVVFHNDIVDETVEICELELPYTYVYGDQDTTLQRAGSHIVKFPQADGCDYVVNLTLATRQVTIIDYHANLCSDGDTYYWDAVEGMERTYTEAADDTIHVYYTGSQCDSILHCIHVTQGEPSLVVTDPQLSGTTGQTLSTTVFGRSECDNNIKVAIEYDLYKDGVMVSPDDYGTLNLTTAIPDLNLSFGRNVHAASGSIPGSTFNMYNYQYGYFYLGFFGTAPNTVTATWNEPGEYKIVFRVVGRTGGMDYPYQSSPGVVIGGGGGSTTSVYATDSLIMYVSGEGGNEGQESDVNNGQNGMITVTAVQDNPVIGATSTFAVNITNPNNITANTKVALDYEVYRDGQLLNTLDGYGTMSFATFYDVTNSMVGRTLEFPDGSIPQASFHMGFYSYGYFTLGFWAQTNNEFTASWQQPGEYKVVFRLVERTGGTPYPLTYGTNPNDTVGGANGSNTGTVLDTNAIVFYIPVAEPAEAVLDTTVCESSLPVTIHGTVFDGEAQQDIHVYSDNGVYDTIYHLTLTVAPAYTAENPVELDSVVCAGVFPFEWNGVTFDEAGTRTATLQTALGCDSVVAMTVTVNVPAHAAYTETACGSYEWNGTLYTESGDYEYSYDNDYGCTVTDTLHLTIHDVTTTPDVVTNCGPYEWNGTLYTESGTYYADREVEYDNDICTVTDTLVLTISPVYNITDEQTLCASELPYTYGDTTFQTGTVSGTYTLRRTTAEGCDSIVTLTLTVNPSGTAVIVDNACGSYTWENGNGETYTESGTYTYEYVNNYGCNATDTLLLTVHHPVGALYEVTACGSYEWNGTLYTESGTYYADREDEDENGCIPTDTLVLIVGQPVPGTYTSATACGSYVWDVDGETYTTSGFHFAYSDPDDFGCVRIDTLDLTVNPVYEVTDTKEIGIAELPFAYGDTLFDLGTVSGTYTLHMFTVEGCDSIVTLTLTVTGGSVSGDAYLVVADNGDGSFDVTAFADQTDPETRVAIAYTLTKDGQPVNLVNYECGGDLYIATDYSGGNFIGQNVSYGNGYIPGSTFLMGNHYHDYFYLHFLNGRTNRIAQSFTEEGSYEITLTLMTRNDGNDIFVPYFYQGATRLVGGEGSTDGEVIATETLTFTVGGGNSNPQPQPAVSGIADSQTGSFTLFPNPARSFVTLRTNADHAAVTVTDMSGKTMISTTADASGDLRINVASWAAGVYFVNLHANGSTTSQKLVITK